MKTLEGKPLRLGIGEFEIDADVKDSTYEARRTFLELVEKERYLVLADLLSIYNLDDVPEEKTLTVADLNYWHWIFNLSLFNQNYLNIDLSSQGVKSTVRETPVQFFSEYLNKKSNEINNSIESLREYWNQSEASFSNKQLYSSALDKIIPNWKTLKLDNDAQELCKSLSKWSEDWNLISEPDDESNWCLDFALKVLREFTIKLKEITPIEKEPYSEISDGELWGLRYKALDLRSEVWRRTISRDSFMHDNLIDYILNKNTQQIQTKGFEFSWKGFQFHSEEEGDNERRTWFPLSCSAEEFKERMEKRFWNTFYIALQVDRGFFTENLRKISEIISEFAERLDWYIQKTKIHFQEEACSPKTASPEKDLKEPANRKQKSNIKFSKTPVENNILYFYWLIDYQIPEVKSFDAIGKKYGYDRTTVSDGIKKISQRIGLQISKKKAGRPKGIKESGRNDYKNW